MKTFSAWNLLRAGLSPKNAYEPYWRAPEPKKSYDAVIIGGGGHGLATAYYLAKTHGMRNIAVLEKGWIGGGNTGRNTTAIRSNYYYPESAGLYEHALKLHEGLPKELNINTMFRQQGLVTLAHSDHDMEFLTRWCNAMHLNGIDSDILTADEVFREIPHLNRSANARYPVMGALIQRRGGPSRHDAVAWGYARGADALGVDILQQCEVTGFDLENGQLQAVRTNRGRIVTPLAGLAVAGHSPVIADMLGLTLPVQVRTLQALVSEPIKPTFDALVLSPILHSYVHQSSKGEIVVGGGADSYLSYTQNGSFHTIEDVIAGMLEMFPSFSRLKLMRHWGGIVDITPDTSPIIDRLPIKGLYVSCGWGTGGFKAIPAGGDVFAHLLARDTAHPLAAAFTFDRFTAGALIDEGAASGVAH